MRIDGPGEPLEQLELDANRLWALDANGKVYFRGYHPLVGSWQSIEPFPVVNRLSRHGDGMILAICKNGEIRTLDSVECDSAAQYPASGNLSIPSLPAAFDGGGPERESFRRWWWPKFGLKHLLGMVLMVAIFMGPVISYREAIKREEACSFLVACGGKFVYEHEIDAQGNPVASPQEPGSEFLRKWLPRHWFVKPVKFVGKENQNISKLPAINSIDEVTLVMESGEEFKSLASLDSLRTVSINGLKTKELTPLPQVCSLKIKLDRHEADQLDLENLVGWSSLTELKAEGDLVKFDFQKHYPKLKSLHVGNYDACAKSIGQLKNLEQLSVESYMTFEPLTGLVGLKHLRVDHDWLRQHCCQHPAHLKNLVNLEYLALEGVPIGDLEWVHLFPNLKYLELEKTRAIVDLSPLAALPKLETVKFYTINDQCRAQLETLGIDQVYCWDDTNGKWTLAKKTVQQAKQEEESPLDFFLRCGNRYSLSVSGYWPNGEPVMDCKPLSDPAFQDLSHVSLPSTIQDFSPIAGLTSLERFTVHSPSFNDVSVLAAMSELYKLDLKNTSISNIDGLSESQINGLGSLNIDGTDISSVQRLASPKTLHFFSANGTRISDLSVMSGQKLVNLYVNNTPVENLPKNLVSLEELSIDSTRISSLEGLANSKLERLSARQTPIEDASVLSLTGSSLRRLDLSESRVRILPSSLPLLNSLRLAGTPVKDLTQLRELQNLRTLDLSATKVTDISPLSELRLLVKLHLSNTDVTDIGALEGLSLLEVLDLSGTTIKDFSPLRNFNNMNKLNLSKTNIQSLECLPKKIPPSRFRRNPRLYLNLSHTAIADLSSLSREISFSELDLSATPINDLTSLAQLKLSSLNLSHTSIRDLAPLAKLPLLESLDISHSTADLSTLKSLEPYLSLSLNLRGCEVSDLSIVTHFRMLDGLAIDCENLKDLSPLAKLTRLSRLELTGVREDHDVSWIRDLPCLNLENLSIERNPKNDSESAIKR